MHPIVNDAVEYPRITERGKQTLLRLYEDPQAPRFNYYCGDRLTESGAATVDAFAGEVRRAVSQKGEPNRLVREAVARAVAQVPYHRREGSDFSTGELSALGTTSRQDLSHDLPRFVADDVDVAELIIHETSGTTARPILVPHHPSACASYLPLFDSMMQSHDLRLEGGQGRLAIALVCDQKTTVTCATIATWLSEAAFIKINLAASEWRSGGDAAAYLDRFAPEILTGDPLSFASLARTAVTHQPKALLSTAMSLSPALKKGLEQRFNCPVIDYYSTMESGPVAMRDGDRYRPIAPDLYVEILDGYDEQVAPGERGELTLTGGRNPFLPLVRYRTGDFARYAPLPTGEFRFDEFEGRACVTFVCQSGARINNIDITRALAPFPITTFQFHQDENQRLVFRAAEAEWAAARTALSPVLDTSKVTFEALGRPGTGGKHVTYHSDFVLRI